MRRTANLSGLGSHRSLLQGIAILAALATALALSFSLDARPAAAQDDPSKYLTSEEMEQLSQAAQNDDVDAIGIVNAKASKDPDSLSFPDTKVGTSSATQNVTVKAESKGCVDVPLFGCLGNFPVKIDSATASGDFDKVSDNCSGNQLPAGATCTIGVKFSPDVEGNRTGSLNIAPGSVTFDVFGVGIFTVPTSFIDGNTVALSGKGLEATSPTVTDFSPTGGKVKPGANATATFSEDMLASSITASGTFTLTRTGSTTPVPAVVTYDQASKTATLDPSSKLKKGATYTAKVTTTAKDLAGNALAQETTWNFKVKKKKKR